MGILSALRTSSENKTGEASSTWIVAFLGNPGKEYVCTRHNAGWIVADTLFPKDEYKFDKYSNAEVHRVDASYLEVHPLSKYRSEEIKKVNTNLILVKPMTFMNLSADAIGYIAKKEAVQTSNIIVVYDDIDIPVGEFRLTTGGGSNHNGVKSLFSRFGRDGFVRLRIGVGDNDRDVPLRGYVLGQFTKDQEECLREVSLSVWEAILDVVMNGVVFAQNKHNKR